jgi:hypothetical protein
VLAVLNPRVLNIILLGAAVKRMELVHINWDEIIWYIASFL